MTVRDLQTLVQKFKAIVKKETGQDFPDDPKKQLDLAILAVFKSWNNKRAQTYRRLNDIPDNLGTAVNVQAMVFGNMGMDSGTGVLFTRNPSTGQCKLFGEYLFNAQGEDVVSGVRTPFPIAHLEKDQPANYNKILRIVDKVEKHYREMQDMEFTIENKKLWILQTRDGKRTAQASLKILVDLVKEGLINKNEAILRVKTEQMDQLLHKQIDPKAKQKSETKGLPASPGAAVGQVVFTADEVVKQVKQGKKVILVRTETSPEDIEGMVLAEGILTARGGMTSHAAVVARGMGKCCVAGCSAIEVNEKQGKFTLNGKAVKRGDYITLNGSTGELYLGKMPVVDPEVSTDLKKILTWVDKVRLLSVRTNADTPEDAKLAREYGAEGIGLCRTEHMFFAKTRIRYIREMILAETLLERQKALAKLLPMQQGDFLGIFKAMTGLPVTIRLLDPPLHEFLPKTEAEVAELSKLLKVSPQKLKARREYLSEFNPMLGHRGCRLGVSHPEIYEMQVRAIFAACLEAKKRKIKAIPEIEIPLVGDVREFTIMKEMILRVAQELKVEGKIQYKIGTMIELPRACVTAHKIALEADFFSFGTNDLTQTTYGLSRDDSSKFLEDYLAQKIYAKDPFAVLDQEGVGALMELAIKLGRMVNPDLEIGICGEHGGEPSSIEFCHRAGLDYVSCSPFRVPIARLAAAQAVLRNNNGPALAGDLGQLTRNS
ncbi:MAG: pyruvate, phosphate dikinase, partial [Candidatus Gracilibacteria bacterium]|nr:pyruvate, phosphate dikinase [Candidatus Gracilibacteria bacterium]